VQRHRRPGFPLWAELCGDRSRREPARLAAAIADPDAEVVPENRFGVQSIDEMPPQTKLSQQDVADIACPGNDFAAGRAVRTDGRSGPTFSAPAIQPSGECPRPREAGFEASVFSSFA
jgi:hypothetical protein